MLIKLNPTSVSGLKALMEERGLPDIDDAANAAIGDFLERVGMDKKAEKREKREEHTRAGAEPEGVKATTLNRDSADYRQGQRHAEIINAQNESLSRKLNRRLPGEG